MIGALHRRRKAGADLTDTQTRLVWRLCALLLDYPGPDTLALVDDLAAAAAEVPGAPGRDLAGFAGHLAGEYRAGRQGGLAQHYVETFDLRRRSSLHLTYYAYGDTRKRGMALLAFKQAYRRAGALMGEHELPDYLPAVLEFAATTDPKSGWQLLAQHRAVLEVLRLSLRDAASPYAAVLDALCATLPPLDTRDREQIVKLAAEGPPEEEVGLDPYAIDPTLTDHAHPGAGCSTGAAPAAPGHLGMPTLGGPR